VATLVARKSNDAVVAPMVGCGGSTYGEKSGVWSQTAGLVLVHLQDSGISPTEDNFTFYLLYKEMLEMS
jgi:hypothetical protein